MKSTKLLLMLVVLIASNPLFAQTTIEAEDAQVIYHGDIETDHTGFSGSGYVNGDNEMGSYIEWAIAVESAGEQSISFTFGNGSTSDRSMILNLNGTDLETISFPGTGAWTTYTTKTTTFTLQQELNVIRLTSNTTNGGPNLDKIAITGNLGTNTFSKIDIKTIGNGSVTITPQKEYYDAGTKVSISATAEAGYNFVGWYEERTNSSTTLNHTVEKDTTLTAMFISDDIYIRTDEQIGWCSVETPATGGAGGEIVTATNQTELKNYLSGSTARIVQISGTITLSPMGTKIDIGSNKTIIGLGNDAAIVGGGLRPKNAENIIISNLNFRDAYVTWDGKTTDNDAIEINNSKHVWVTHCALSHFDDGLCDIKNGSDYITVSWCYFFNHNKVMLIGSGDGETQDIGHLNVTLHHNWFDGRYGNGMGQRLPMCRFGKIHVFNNYYSTNSVRGIEGNYDSNVVVDNNYFDNIIMPHVLVGSAGDNKMNASGNIYANNTGSRRDADGDAFNPSDFYSYSMLDAEAVPIIAMLGVGPGAPTEIGKAPTAINTNSFASAELVCYPNPAKDRLTIELSATTNAMAQVCLTALSGQEYNISTKQPLETGKNTFTINTTAIPSGNYIVKVVSDSAVQTKLIRIE